MFAPICPLCCKTFTEWEQISAIHCGHVFHQNCVQTFRDLTRRFDGCRGCPVCGPVCPVCGPVCQSDPACKDRCCNKGDNYDKETCERKQQQIPQSGCHCATIDSLVHLRFVFSRRSLAVPRLEEDDTRRLQEEKLERSERANRRLLDEIRELESKLKALISMMKTMHDRLVNPKSGRFASRWSGVSFFPSASSLTIGNQNDNNNSADLRITASLPAFPSNDPSELEGLDGGRGFFSGLIQLASHILLDYSKSPVAIRRDFGKLRRRSRESRRLREEQSDCCLGEPMHQTALSKLSHGPIAKEQWSCKHGVSSTRSKPADGAKTRNSVISDHPSDDGSIDSAIDPLDCVSSQSFHDSTSSIWGKSCSEGEISQLNSVCHSNDPRPGNDGSSKTVNADCQTEFWYESEWDEDLYEIDWDYEPFEKG